MKKNTGKWRGLTTKMKKLEKNSTIKINEIFEYKPISGTKSFDQLYVYKYVRTAIPKKFGITTELQGFVFKKNLPTQTCIPKKTES